MTKASAHGNIILAFGTRDAFAHGEMAEWSKAPVLKTGDVKASVGSNPTLSAKLRHMFLQKYPSGRRGSPAKGVGGLKTRARVRLPPSAPKSASIARCLPAFFTSRSSSRSKPHPAGRAGHCQFFPVDFHADSAYTVLGKVLARIPPNALGRRRRLS